MCNLSHHNSNTHVDKSISIRILFKRWLEYFLKDYIKLKKKLNSCTNNGEESICINKCKKKCVCAGKWAEEKMKEWEKVKKRFFNQYNVDNLQKIYQVKSFLGQTIYSTDVQNALNEGEDLESLQKSDVCYNSGRSDKKQCDEKDVIEILLNRLTEKIEPCKTKDNQEIDPNSCDPYTQTEELYDEKPLDDDTSTTSVVPEICKDFVPPEPAPPSLPEQEEKDKAKEDRGKEEVPFTPSLPPEDLPPEKNVPVPPPKKPETTPKQRKKQKRQLPTHTSILPEMLSISSFPLTVGVAFAALSYFLLKVIYKYIYA